MKTLENKPVSSQGNSVSTSEQTYSMPVHDVAKFSWAAWADTKEVSNQKLLTLSLLLLCQVLLKLISELKHNGGKKKMSCRNTISYKPHYLKKLG